MLFRKQTHGAKPFHIDDHPVRHPIPLATQASDDLRGEIVDGR
jgi:hypothetical protein